MQWGVHYGRRHSIHHAFKKKKKNVPILKDRSVTLLIVGSDAIQSVKDFFVKIKAGDFFIIFFYTESKMDS